MRKNAKWTKNNLSQRFSSIRFVTVETNLLYRVCLVEFKNTYSMRTEAKRTKNILSQKVHSSRFFTVNINLLLKFALPSMMKCKHCLCIEIIFVLDFLISPF